MISHKYKCIFIHIAKCAGTSIEFALDVNVDDKRAEKNNNLFGWDNKNKLWLQHATPQQLLDLNLITEREWHSYYKFIVYRNSWDRAQSDYKWMEKEHGINDSFANFLSRRGKFNSILTDNTNNNYAGDHLEPQISYFFINGRKINYDMTINFDKLSEGLKRVERDMNLSSGFFDYKLNVGNHKKGFHYSQFYNSANRDLVEKKYKQDIDYFGFTFEDRKGLINNIKSRLDNMFTFKSNSNNSLL